MKRYMLVNELIKDIYIITLTNLNLVVSNSHVQKSILTERGPLENDF